MNPTTDEREYREDLQKRQLQQLELDKAREVAKAERVAEADDLVSEFLQNPEQVARYIAELEASGQLEGAVKELLLERVLNLAGPEFVESVLGRFAPDAEQAGPSLDELVEQVSAQAEEVARPELMGHDNVVDLDAERAARTARLLETLAATMGLAAKELTVHVDDEAAQRTGARGAHGLMDDGHVYLHPDHYDPETRSGRELLAHEVTHVAQQSELHAGGLDAMMPSKSAAELEAASFATAFGGGSVLGRPEAVLPAGDVAADTDIETVGDETPKKPVQLTIQGPGGLKHTVTVDPGKQSITGEKPNWNIPGVTIDSVALRFDDQQTLKSGTAKGKIGAGQFEQAFTLKITPQGKTSAKISLTFDGEFDVPGLLKPIKTKFTITNKGFSAKLTVQEEHSEMLGLKTSGSLTLKSSGQGLETSGNIKLRDEGDTLQGDVSITYKGGAVAVEGFLNVNGMTFLVDDGALKLKVDYTEGKTVIQLAEPVEKTKEHGNFKTIFKVDSAKFGAGEKGSGLEGKGGLDVDFKNVGTASGEVTIANGKVEDIALTFDNYDFKLPKEGEEALIEGTLNGGISLKDGGEGMKFSEGNLGGEFGVKLPGLNADEKVGLALTANVGEDGAVSGSFGLSEGAECKIGSMLKITSMTAGFESAEGITSFEGAAAFDFSSGGKEGGDSSEGGAAPLQVSGEVKIAKGEGGFSYSGTGTVQGNAGPVTGGTITVSSAEGGGLDVKGTVDVGNLANGKVKPFTLEAEYNSESGNLLFKVAEVQLEVEKIGAAQVQSAKLSNIEYNATSGMLAAQGDIQLELPMLGVATAQLKIEENDLASAEFTFTDGQVIKLPKDAPVLEGNWTGSLKLSAGGFEEAALNGDLKFAHEGINGGEAVELKLEAAIDKEGKFTGGAKLAKGVKLNNFLELKELDANITSEGDYSIGGKVAIAVPGTENCEVAVRYADGQFTAEGEAEFKSSKQGSTGKPLYAGKVSVSYSEAGWGVAGEVTVTGIKGVKEFTAGVKYEGEELTITCPRAEFELPEVKGVKTRGELEDIEYNVTTGSFSGEGEIEVEFPAIGKASAEVEVKDNEIVEVELEFETDELKFPSDNPVVSGKFAAEVTFAKGEFSKGEIKGTDVKLAIPGLNEENPVQMEFEAAVAANGALSGYIKTTSEFELNKYLSLKNLEVKLDGETGEVSGEGTMDIKGFKNLESASITVGLNEAQGFHVKEAGVKVAFGSEEDRFWGSVGVSYSTDEGFGFDGELSARIKKGMVAKGSVGYRHKTGELNAELRLDDITLYEGTSFDRNLFEFDIQAMLFTLWGTIGIFLDAGAGLNFGFNVEPIKFGGGVGITGLELDSFNYEKIELDAALTGGISANLSLIPRLGIGLCIGTPQLASVAGGVKFPIEASATLRPTLEGKLTYKDGELQGEGKIDAPLVFGITASLNPYAKVSALAGAFEHEWNGGSLANFELLPPKEIFRLEMDFGKDLPEGGDASSMAPSGTPKDAAGPPPKEQEGGGQVQAKADAPANQAEGSVASGLGDTGPFDMAGALDGVKNSISNSATMQKMKKVIEGAKELAASIGKGFQTVYNWFKSWFSNAFDKIVQVMDELRGHGWNVASWLGGKLKAAVDPEIYQVIEPIVNYGTSLNDALMDLITGPSIENWGLDDWMKWAFDAAGLAVSSITGLFDAAKKVGGRFIDLIKTLTARGDIYVDNVSENWGPDDYKYRVKLPGIMDERGESWTIAKLMLTTLSWMGVPKSNDDPEEYGT